MESLFHKLMLGLLIVCLCAVLAVIGYMILKTPGEGSMNGTLVQAGCETNRAGGDLEI